MDLYPDQKNSNIHLKKKVTKKGKKSNNCC